MSPLMFDHASRHQSMFVKMPPFEIIPAKVQDVRRLVDIEFHAFENERVNQVLSYRDYKKPAHFARSVQAYQSALDVTISSPKVKEHRPSIKQTRPLPTSRVSFKKIVDTEHQEIVSFAKVEMKTYTPEELRAPEDIGHEGEPKMNRDWFGLNERLRRQYVGLSAHCYIGMLATEPKFQHHGAGTMLLQDILADADSAGVEVYLEATDTAKPLYEKHGFKAITELRFDPSEYGLQGLGTERQTVMVRAALGADGVRQAVRSWEDVVAS